MISSRFLETSFLKLLIKNLISLVVVVVIVAMTNETGLGNRLVIDFQHI